MALGGTVTWMMGFQVTVVFPVTLVALTTGRGLGLSWVTGTGVKVAGPVAWLSAVML
jgi:hypothetical protein